MKKIKVLLCENIHPLAFAEEKLNQLYEVKRISHSPDENELLELLKEVEILGIRSKTNLTASFFSKLKQLNLPLKSIGCFCIGTNQVDLKSARTQAIAVFNAPHSNTRSVAEIVIAQMINLSRNLGDKNSQCHNGSWDKSAENCFEVRGKILGIVGYGHIGSQVSVLAESLGLTVYFYDTEKKLPLGNARSVSLDELLRVSDFMTIHVPELPSTYQMIGEKELSLMKPTSFLINYSRGSVINISDLAESLKNNKIAGAAIDVFPVEPSSNKEKFESPLRGVKNVILTPHIGGSTMEAQRSIGLEVSESLHRYNTYGDTSGSVNFPIVSLGQSKSHWRLLNIHLNQPGVLGEINNLISTFGINIEAQSLATLEDIGYLAIDFSHDQAVDILPKLTNQFGLSRSISSRLISFF